MNEALEALRDIHPPPDPAVWPPAPGWYALCALLIAAIGAVAYRLLLLARARRPRRRALEAIAQLDRRARLGEDPSSLAAEISALLRRCAMHRFGRSTVGGLSGPRWIAFLDETGGEFAPVAGLMEYAYRPGSAGDVRPLLDAVRRWVEANL